ncbi:MAG: rod shape-determining protein MreD [Actinomycetota bacterium]|jgi:rod shape-determining protein MreD|nr:rod shape-determining protein MreD [Actinomycetota bacterium]
MTTATRLPPLLLGAVVLHTAVFPQLRLFGVAADVLLLLAIAAGLTGGPDRGAAVGFGMGLLADCFLQTPFGLSALAYSLVAYAVGAFASTILHTGRWIPVLTTLVASAGGVVAFAVLGLVLGQEQLMSLRLVTVAVMVGVLNAALSPLALRAMRWALAPRPVSGPVLR